jgi:hypothetical protein
MSRKLYRSYVVVPAVRLKHELSLKRFLRVIRQYGAVRIEWRLPFEKP